MWYKNQGESNNATSCVCFCFVWDHMPHSLTEIKYRNVYPRLQSTHTSKHRRFYSARWKQFHFQLLIHRSNYFLPRSACAVPHETHSIQFSWCSPQVWLDFSITVLCTTKLFGNEIIRKFNIKKSLVLFDFIFE